ncbi:hypothetical protein [Neobacillus cucumis]|uniref:hypothetical protein n=1 Tax=Neobacillus cucumis TaxID=1740721 RepID=UPI001962802D|nr:hypothetical protein [Neobacillus cucumis]MBM7651759.1 hypothetical protein [Neobacillus cucumis]
MFNEYEKYLMMKLRQEEVERNARNVWKLEHLQKESFFKKLLTSFKARRESTTVKTNCECVCC